MTTGCPLESCAEEWYELTGNSAQPNKEENETEFIHCNGDECHCIYWAEEYGNMCYVCKKHFCEGCSEDLVNDDPDYPHNMSCFRCETCEKENNFLFKKIRIIL